MRFQVACPICGGKTEFKSHGIIAPWISSLIKSANQETQLLVCLECDFHYFSYRYNQDELKNLYLEYRNGQYLKKRHKWEPWYSKAENNIFDPQTSQVRINSRKLSFIQQLNSAGVDINKFSQILDFGGDQGQFFPDGFKGEKFLCDLSGADTSFKEGITRVGVLAQMNGKVDLVMACGVMEHVSDLRRLQSEIFDVMVKGATYFVEVPLDSFKTHKMHKTNFYRKYLICIVKIRTLFVLVDFLSGVYRNFFRHIPFWGIVKQSEHINYFTPRSLSQLMSLRHETLYVSKADYKKRHGKFRLGYLAGVARK